MSYAAVAKQNRDPLDQQPQPDTALLNTDPSSQADVGLPDGDSTKVSVVPTDFKEHPKSAAAQVREDIESKAKEAMDASPSSSGNMNGSAKRKERKDRAKETIDEYEEEGLVFWNRAKRVILQPGVAGGIIGIVNLGLIGTLGYRLYTEPGLRHNERFLATSAITALALFGAEGAAAEAYRKTEAGQREERKAREEGAAVYKHAKDVILRPGVLGGLVGVVNVGILGGVGYWSWVNWDRPTWDRRAVTTTTVALLALFAGEGYLGEEYREKEYPKRK